MPQVALESAVITHGLPRPLNVTVARRLEAILRDEGCDPTTIGVVDGVPICGLTRAQIERLGNDDEVRKLSLRDLPVAVARGLSGGTTVAASLHIAAAHGVRVFATGGIGGVHRRLSEDAPLDISADLLALARYPVCTVCAGAKAILDLPATVEALEALGVTVLGFGTDTFPAFYSPGSELPVDARLDAPDDIAVVVRERGRLGLRGGVLVVVPIPSEHGIATAEIEPHILEAVAEAKSLGLRSAAVTPFLLERLAAATGEHTLRANQALLENNARVAARIATALQRIDPSPSPYP